MPSRCDHDQTKRPQTEAQSDSTLSPQRVGSQHADGDKTSAPDNEALLDALASALADEGARTSTKSSSEASAEAVTDGSAEASAKTVTEACAEASTEASPEAQAKGADFGATTASAEAKAAAPQPEGPAERAADADGAAVAAIDPGAARAADLSATTTTTATAADAATAATAAAAGGAGGAEPVAQALEEEGAQRTGRTSEFALNEEPSTDAWFSPQVGVAAATQLYHPGQDPCPQLHERSEQAAPDPEGKARLRHACGAELDLSYVYPELSELFSSCPEFATRLNNEMLAGSNQLCNQLVLYRNLEQLGAQGLPDLNAAELRKLIAESLKSLSFAQLDEYCKLFWGLPPKREDELKNALQQSFERMERNLLSYLYAQAQHLGIVGLSAPPLDEPSARKNWFERVGLTCYRNQPYMQVHNAIGALLGRVGKLVVAPTAVWLLTGFSAQERSAGVELMRNQVFEAYAQYEEDIRTYLKAHPFTDPKELDEVIFYAYLLADKTHLESDYEQYEALVHLSNQLTLFKLMSGGFCRKSNFEFDLVNYVNRYVGKSALTGDDEPRDESDLASSSMGGPGAIFKTQYRNLFEFKRLLPEVYGLHFCYLHSVLELSLNGLENFVLPCTQLRVHLYNLTRLTNTIYIKRADQRADTTALDLNLGFVSPLHAYLMGQDALAIGRRAIKEFNWRTQEKDSAGVFYYQILAADSKQGGMVATLPEYRQALNLFKDQLSAALAQGEFTPQMEQWALHLYVKQRIFEQLAPVGVPVTAAAGNRLAQWSSDNLRTYMELMGTYVVFCHNLIFKHFMAGSWALQQYDAQRAAASATKSKKGRVGAKGGAAAAGATAAGPGAAGAASTGAASAAAALDPNREHVFLDHFLSCNARIGSSVCLYDDKGAVLTGAALAQRVALGGAPDEGGHFKTVRAAELGGSKDSGEFSPKNYVPGLKSETSPELIAAAQQLCQDPRLSYMSFGRVHGQVLGCYHDTDWVLSHYRHYQVKQVSSYGELIGDNGMVALMPGTPAWSAYLLGRAWYTGELIGVKNLYLGYAFLSYADLSGCYEASSYLATMCQPLFLMNANDEGRLFLVQHLRALVSYHLGRIAFDFGHYRVRLFRSYDRYIERHDLATAIAQLVGQDPDLRRVVEANNPTLFNFGGGSSAGHITSHGGHSAAVVQAALQNKGWDLGAWFEASAQVLATGQPYSVHAFEQAQGVSARDPVAAARSSEPTIGLGEVLQVKGQVVSGISHPYNADGYSNEWDPKRDFNSGRTRFMRTRLHHMLDLGRALESRLSEAYIPVDLFGHKGGLPLQEVNTWGVVLANTILVLCDFLTKASFMAARYQVLIERLMSDLAELMRREYCPDGCFAIFKYLITPLPQHKNFELVSPNYWVTILYGQLTGTGALDCSPLNFYPDDSTSHNLELAVMFLQLGMVLPEYREQGYALVADLIENTAGDLVPVVMPYLDEYVRGAAAQQEGAALHYLAQAARLKHDDTLADLLSLLGGRAQDCRAFKDIAHYLVKHKLTAERKNFAQHLFFMHQPYGLYEQYLSLRDDPKELNLAHSCLFYAAALQVPEARTELEALEAAGKFQPLPFIIYLKYLQELAQTNVQARAVLMMLSVNGDILPPDFMSLYRLADDAHKTFANSALKAELLKRGVMGPNHMSGSFSQRSSWVGIFGPELNTLWHNNKTINGNFAHWQGAVEMVDLETYAFLNFGLSDHKIQAVVRKLFEALSQGTSYLERLLTYNWLRSDLFPEFLQEQARQVNERINTVESTQDYAALVCMQRLFANVMDLRFNDYASTFSTALCAKRYRTDRNMRAVGVVSYNLLNDGLLRPSYSQLLYGALYSLREVGQPNFALFKGFCRYLGNLGQSAAQRYALLNYAHLSVAPYGEAFERSIMRPREDALRAAAPFLSGSLVHGSAITRLIGQMMQRRINSGLTDYLNRKQSGAAAADPGDTVEVSAAPERAAAGVAGAAAKAGVAAGAALGGAGAGAGAAAAAAAEGAAPTAVLMGPYWEQKEQHDGISLSETGAPIERKSVGAGGFYTSVLVRSVLGDTAAQQAQAAPAGLDFADLRADAHDLVVKLGLSDRSTTLARALGVRWRRNAESPAALHTLDRAMGGNQLAWDQTLANGSSPAPLSYYLDLDLPEEIEIYLEALVTSSYFLYSQCSSLYQLLLYCRNGWQLGRKPHGAKRSFASLLARDMMRGMPDSCSNYLYYCQSHLFKYDFGGNFHENEQIKLARKFMEEVLQIDDSSPKFAEYARKMAREGFGEFSSLLSAHNNGFVPGKLRFMPPGTEQNYNPQTGYITYYQVGDEMLLETGEAEIARGHLRDLCAQLDRLCQLTPAQRQAYFEPSDDELIAHYYERNAPNLKPQRLQKGYRELIERLKLRALMERVLAPDDFERLLQLERCDFMSTTFSREEQPTSLNEVMGLLGYTCSIMPYAALKQLSRADQSLVLTKSGLLDSYVSGGEELGTPDSIQQQQRVKQALAQARLAIAQGHELWGFNYERRERRWQSSAQELTFVAKRAASNFHESFNSYHTFGTTYTNSSYQLACLHLNIAAERAQSAPGQVGAWSLAPTPSAVRDSILGEGAAPLGPMAVPERVEDGSGAAAQVKAERELLAALESGREYHGPLFNDESYYGYHALVERLTKIALTYGIDFFGRESASGFSLKSFTPQAPSFDSDGLDLGQMPQRVRTRRGVEADLSARREADQFKHKAWQEMSSKQDQRKLKRQGFELEMPAIEEPLDEVSGAQVMELVSKLHETQPDSILLGGKAQLHADEAADAAAAAAMDSAADGTAAAATDSAADGAAAASDPANATDGAKDWDAPAGLSGSLRVDPTDEIEVAGDEHSSDLFSRLQSFISDKLALPEGMIPLSALATEGNKDKPQLEFEPKDAYGVFERYADAALDDGEGVTTFNEESDGPGTYLRYLYQHLGRSGTKRFDPKREYQPCRPHLYYEEDSPLNTLIYLLVMRGMIDLNLDDRYHFEQGFLSLFARLGYYYGACDIIDSAFVTVPYMAYKTRFERKDIAAKDAQTYTQIIQYLLTRVFDDAQEASNVIKGNDYVCTKDSAKLARYLNLPEYTPPFVLKRIVVSCGDGLSALHHSWYWKSMLSLSSDFCTPSKVMYLLDDSLVNFALYDWLAQPDLIACAPNLQDSITATGVLSLLELCSGIGFDRDWYEQLIMLSNKLGRILTYEEQRALKAGTLSADELKARAKREAKEQAQAQAQALAQAPKNQRASASSAARPKANRKGLNHVASRRVSELKNFAPFTPLRESFAPFWLNFTRPEFLLRHRDPEIDPRLESYLKVWYQHNSCDSLSNEQRIALRPSSVEITQLQTLLWEHVTDRFELTQLYFPQRLKHKLKCQWVGAELAQREGNVFLSHIGECSLGRNIITYDEGAQLLCYPPCYVYNLASGLTISYGRELEVSEISRLTPLLMAGYDYQVHFVCDPFSMLDPLKCYLDCALIEGTAQQKACTGDLYQLARKLWGFTQYTYYQHSKLQLFLDQHYWDLNSRELRYNFDQNLAHTNFVDDLELIHTSYRTKMWYSLQEQQLSPEHEHSDYRYFLASGVNLSLGMPLDLNLSAEISEVRTSLGLSGSPHTLSHKLIGSNSKSRSLILPRSEQQELAAFYLKHPDRIKGEDDLTREVELLKALKTESAYLQQSLKVLGELQADLEQRIKAQQEQHKVVDQKLCLSLQLLREGKVPHLAALPQLNIERDHQVEALQFDLSSTRPEYHEGGNARHNAVESKSDLILERVSAYTRLTSSDAPAAGAAAGAAAGGELRGGTGAAAAVLAHLNVDPDWEDEVAGYESVFDGIYDELSAPDGTFRASASDPLEDLSGLTEADLHDLEQESEQAQEQAPAPAPATGAEPSAQFAAESEAKSQPSMAERLVKMSTDEGYAPDEDELSAAELEALADDDDDELAPWAESDDDEAFDAVPPEEMARFAQYLIDEGVDLWDINAVADMLIKLRLRRMMSEGYSQEQIAQMLEQGEISFDQEIAISDLLSTNAQFFTQNLESEAQPQADAKPQVKSSHHALARPPQSARKNHSGKRGHKGRNQRK